MFFPVIFRLFFTRHPFHSTTMRLASREKQTEKHHINNFGNIFNQTLR